MRYVTPNGRDGQPVIREGQQIGAGAVLGTVQDRARRDPNGRMENHVHMEIRDQRNRRSIPNRSFVRSAASVSAKLYRGGDTPSPHSAKSSLSSSELQDTATQPPLAAGARTKA